MNDIPLSSKKEVGYRTHLSSKGANEQNFNSMYDILQLYKLANTLNDNIKQLNEINSYENQYTSIKLQEIGKSIVNTNTTEKTFFASDFYLKDADSNSGNIDSFTNCITANAIACKSKISCFDNILNQTFIPNSISVTAYPAADGLNIIDNDINNAINKSNMAYYRKVIADNTVTEVSLDLYIAIPTNVVESKKVNSIVVHPFPTGMCDITDVSYKDSDGYTTIPTYDTHYGNVLDSINKYNDVNSLRFDFNSVNAVALKVSIRQRHYIDIGNNQRLFVLGFKYIDLFNNTYSDDYSSVYLDIPINSKTRIDNIQLFLNNSGMFNGNQIETELYYVKDSTMHKIENTFPVIFDYDSSLLTIKLKIYCSGDCTPNIHKLCFLSTSL